LSWIPEFGNDFKISPSVHPTLVAGFRSIRNIFAFFIVATSFVVGTLINLELFKNACQIIMKQRISEIDSCMKLRKQTGKEIQ
jgi:hypothetical protein